MKSIGILNLANIKNVKRKKKYLFLIVLVGIFFSYGYHIITFSPPYSIHQWRQADALSLALNYFKEGNEFFSA